MKKLGKVLFSFVFALMLCSSFFITGCDLFDFGKNTIVINFYVGEVLADSVTIKANEEEVKSIVPSETKLEQLNSGNQFLLGWYLDRDFEREFNNENVAVKYLLDLRNDENSQVNVYARYTSYESLFEFSSVGEPAYAQINGLTDLGKTAKNLVIPNSFNYNDNGNIQQLAVNELRFDNFSSNVLKTLKISAQVNNIDFYNAFNSMPVISNIVFEEGSIYKIIDEKFICETVEEKNVLRFVFDVSAQRNSSILLCDNINKIQPTSNYNIFEKYLGIIVPASVEEIDASYTNEPFYLLEDAHPVLNGSQTYTYYMWSEWNHDYQNPQPVNA